MLWYLIQTVRAKKGKNYISIEKKEVFPSPQPPPIFGHLLDPVGSTVYPPEVTICCKFILFIRLT